MGIVLEYTQSQILLKGDYNSMSLVAGTRLPLALHRAQSLGLRVWNSGFRVQDLVFAVPLKTTSEQYFTCDYSAASVRCSRHFEISLRLTSAGTKGLG